MGSNRWQSFAREMKGAIQRGELLPGARIPSETDLSIEWGVSKMTVHRVMQDLQSAGLVERRPRLGTVVSRCRRLKRVGVLMYDSQDNPQANYLQGISRGLPPDCELVFHDTLNSAAREAGILELLLERADGVILYSTGAPANTDVLERVSKIIPLVCVDRVPDGVALNAFVTDEYNSSLVGLKILTDRGHKRIAHFTDDILQLSSVRGRLDAYLTALSGAGTLGTQWLRTFDGTNMTFGAFAEMVHVAFVTMMRMNDPPTALFCAHDNYMSAILASCERLGFRIPDDFELLSVNDTPSLPIVAIDRVHRIVPQTADLGRLAALRLAELSSNFGAPPVVKRLPSMIVPASWLDPTAISISANA